MKNVFMGSHCNGQPETVIHGRRDVGRVEKRQCLTVIAVRASGEEIF